jgi:adenine-specific DNA glycosylase
MSLVRQPVRAPHEIPPEAAKRIPWMRRRLLCWFARNGRSFPWREAGITPYEVIVAEILLQKTTAAGVARAYLGFLKRYPSWIAIAQAPLAISRTRSGHSGFGGRRRWHSSGSH